MQKSLSTASRNGFSVLCFNPLKNFNVQKKNVLSFLMLFKKHTILTKRALCALVLLFTFLGFSQVQAQIVQRGVATTATSTSSTITINKPTGVVAGDVMLVNLAKQNDRTTVPSFSGWTLIDGISLGGTTQRYGAVLYKIATGSEPANYSFALGTNTNYAAGGIVAFSGVDISGSTPFDVVPGTILVSANSITGVSASSIKTVTANSAVIMFGQVAGSNQRWDSWTTTTPGSLQELFDIGISPTGNADGSSVGAAWAIKPTVGFTGNGSATLGSAERNGGILIALKPILSPPTITGLGSASGCVGSSLVITGTNFSGATAVTIGNTAVASYIINSSTQITATVGSGTTGTVKVTTPGGTATSTATFTVNPLPAPIAGGATTVCVGSSTPAFTNATPSGTWSTSNSSIATINSSGVLTGVTSGTVNVIYTLPTGCAVSSGTITVLQTPIITSNPNNTNINAGANGSFTVAASGTPTSYTWQMSSNGGATWTTVTNGGVYSNATTATLNITGATLAMNGYQYRASATNACGTSVVSASATLSVNLVYCTSSGGIYPNGITGVNFNTINNIGTTVDTGYQDFTSHNTVIGKGLSYNLNVYVNTGGNYTDFQSAYIDWNGNGSFTDTGESYSLGSVTNLTNGLTTLSITVPAGAIAGTTRMRIQSRYSDATTGPCQTGFYGEVEDYTLIIVNTVACVAPTAQPTALILSPANTSITGSFTAASPAPDRYLVVVSTSATPPSPVNGTAYTIGSTVGAGYTVVDTDSDVYFTATGLSQNTLYYIYVFSYNNLCSGGPLYYTPNPLSGSTKTLTSTICTPVITVPNSLYINSFQFVGTLNDNITPNISGPSGYSNFTNLTPVVQQPQGSVLNIIASAKGANGLPKSGYWKAWVDFNNDGTFTDSDIVTVVGGERVYSLTKFSTESLTFGFVIPSTTPVGKYRFRLRVGNTTTFDSCTNLATGETEDYVFEVIADCAAKVNTATLADVSRCGTGPVTLTATGTGTGIRWYAAATGGTPLYDGANFPTTVTENTRVTYYVVAYNATCESVFRIPVTAIANEGPVVNFGSVPSFCAATTSGQLITAANGKRFDVLLNEPFNSGLGKFAQSATEPGYLDRSATYWENRPSPYIPRSTTDVPAGLYEGLAPALSSGYTGGNFAISNTDYKRSGRLLNRLTLSGSLDTRNFENLKLEFDLYYFTLITADTDPNLINYFSVDYSLDGGNNWLNLPNLLNLPDPQNPQPNIPNINANQGNPNNWRKILVDLPSTALNVTSLKIRFSSYSYGGVVNGKTIFKESIAAIDNVKIYGIKDESSLFTWSSPTGGILYKQDCTTPLLGTDKAGTICVKPTTTQFENNVQFNITATANFSNGCPATGTLALANDLQVYDTTTSTDWNTAVNWKPGGTIPTADKCVIVKKPVIISSGTNGLAKNIIIEPAGTLSIAGSLTVTDWVNNQALPAAVVVESGGNLLQVNDGVNINTGSITAKKIMNISAPRKQYNYMISPLEGQSLKTIYPGIDYVLYHNETNNYFYNSSGAYIRGRGLAVKEPNTSGTGVPAGNTTVTATYTGQPTNGSFTFGMINSAPSATAPANTVRGYNLTGNPYPSNIDLVKLYSINGGAGGTLSSTFYFWDSTVNDIYVQQGSNYGGQSYGIYNTESGIGTFATGDIGTASILKPTQYVKVGKSFMARSLSATTNLLFNNSIRTYNSAPLNSKETSSASGNRYWLSLVSPADIASTIAVAYFDGGNDEYARDDSFSLMGSDAIYSVVENEKLAINGKSPFAATDVVELGTAHFAAGNYRIMLREKEGIFANGQNIYLKDRQTGIITNLSAGNYSFEATAGETTGRFEIIYQPEAVLATDGTTKENLVVYKDGNNFVVKAQSKKITDLELFDAAGRLMRSFRPNSFKTIIPADQLLNGVYILKINQNGEITTKKVIR